MYMSDAKYLVKSRKESESALRKYNSQKGNLWCPQIYYELQYHH